MSKLFGPGFVVAFPLAAVACLTTIDESLIPCLTCDAGAADASVEAGRDGGPGGDASTATPGARCGMDTTCTAPKAVCCVTQIGVNDYRMGSCDTAQDCPSGDYFTCTRPSDCVVAGHQCCVVDKAGAFTRTECAASCAGTTTICEPTAGGCAGRTCAASPTLPGLFECQ